MWCKGGAAVLSFSAKTQRRRGAKRERFASFNLCVFVPSRLCVKSRGGCTLVRAAVLNSATLFLRAVLSTEYLLPLASALLFVLFAPHHLQAAPPKLNYLFPAGAQRGQSLTITAGGEFSAWPPLVWVDRPGVTITPDQAKGKLNVQVTGDAVPGVYWLRLADGEGASQLRPFVIGTLPEVAEVETNDLPDKPQVVEPRVVVNGKLARSGDVDGYRVELRQGQTLVAALAANSVLGSPMDAVLQVCELVEQSDARIEAFVLAENHDAVGLDPLIAFTAPRDGAYLVRLFAFPATPDSSIRFAGGDDYVYRLTLTTGGYLDHALPLAIENPETPVELGGWNLDGVQPSVSMPKLDDELTPPDGPLAWVWSPDAAGAIGLPCLSHASKVVGTLRVPSDDSAAKSDGTRSVPATVSGRLEAAGEVDEIPLDAVKDRTLRIRVAAKGLGFPTDAYVTVQGESGKVLAEADDAGRDDRDPVLEFTPPADGRYRVLIRDLARRGGVRMVYRLSIEPVQPDFSLSLAADSFVLEKDKPLEIPVNVAVRDGLRGPIEIRAVGLPPGVVAEPVLFEPSGDSQPASSGSGRRGGRRGGGQPATGPSAKLVLKADSAVAQIGGTPLRIEGRTVGSSPLVRTARFPLNLPLAGAHHAVWLTVKK
jgi:hypothetical protein